MLRILYQPYLFEKPVSTKATTPFSFHSLLEVEKAPNESEAISPGEENSTNFIQDLQAALPDRLSKNARRMKHSFDPTNSPTDFGISTVFVRSRKAFLIEHHTRFGSPAVPGLEMWEELGDQPIFLRLSTPRGPGFHYVRLTEEPRLELKDGDFHVVSLERHPWAFADPLDRISEPFLYKILPEWAVPTIAQVTFLALSGEEEFLPSCQYLAGYFFSTAMRCAESFRVDVPTLDGKHATLQLEASEFGVVRRATVFKEACSAVVKSSSGFDFVGGWFDLPGLRLSNYLQAIRTRDSKVSLGIVSGNSGVGKSFLVSRLASSLELSSLVAHPAAFSLKDALSMGNKPALLVLENAHEYLGTQADGLDVDELFGLMDSMPHLLVLALTPCPAKLHARLVSKADFHVELERPTARQRRTILKDMIHNAAPTASLDSALLDKLSEACPGFLMADLHTLVSATLAKGPPLLEGFLASKRLVHQANHLPQSQKIPPVFFHQVGGLEEAKTVLKRLSLRLLGSSAQIAGGKGALMYGPPGTGKTLLGKALATEASANFLPVRIPDLIRGEIGASEKALAGLFSQARISSPCIMFLDELDALFGNRASSSSTHASRLVAQFILELDGLDSSVIVLATTNHPLAIDRSVLRPGRIDHHIYLPPPNPQERLAIFTILLPTLAGDSGLLDQLARLTDGFTGADLSALKHRAQVLAHDRSPQASVTPQDVLNALDPAAPCPLIPSVSASHLEEFRAFQNNLD